MTEPNPPEPPPLLREPPRHIPTAAESQQKQEEERLKKDALVGYTLGARFTSEGPPYGCGCAALIILPLLAALAFAAVYPSRLIAKIGEKVSITRKAT
jgi:hypothetical protein